MTVHDFFAYVGEWVTIGVFGAVAFIAFRERRDRRDLQRVPKPERKPAFARYIPAASPHPLRHETLWLEAPTDDAAWKAISA